MSECESEIFRVLPRQVGTTVAASLRQWLPGKSWSQVRGLLHNRRVMVSGNVCVDEGRRLKLQDVVKILPYAAPEPPEVTDIRIAYLDRDVVVVEKPAGITTVRHIEERDWPWRRKQLQPTLDEMLPTVIAKHIAQEQRDRLAANRRGNGPRPEKAKNAGGGSKRTPPPVRAVHRLDRETSGLIVFARTVVAQRGLEMQFRRHTTHRRYVAVALGPIEAQTIESRLVRDRGDGRRGSTKLPEVGKRAVTHIRPLEQLGPYTLVECRLETGRTHQIRIHLAEKGHPLCGEKVYIQPLFGKAIVDRSGAPRIALHAAELGFDHPVTGEPLRFEMPLPDDLTQFVARLRHEASTTPPDR
jgi:23S rRNA pseudouridine1911/1915/1917 synthase